MNDAGDRRPRAGADSWSRCARSRRSPECRRPAATRGWPRPARAVRRWNCAGRRSCESATTADSRLSTAASSATVNAEGSSGRIRSARNCGNVRTSAGRWECRRTCDPMVSTGRLKIATAAVPSDAAPRSSRARAVNQRGTSSMIASETTPSPSAAGSKRRAAERAEHRHARQELARRIRRSARPRKSLICVEAMRTAMPLVKPMTTGRGMNLHGLAQAGDAPGPAG